jgi:hypothetical protein
MVKNEYIYAIISSSCIVALSCDHKQYILIKDKIDNRFILKTNNHGVQKPLLNGAKSEKPKE